MRGATLNNTTQFLYLYDFLHLLREFEVFKNKENGDELRIIIFSTFVVSQQ